MRLDRLLPVDDLDLDLAADLRADLERRVRELTVALAGMRVQAALLRASASEAWAAADRERERADFLSDQLRRVLDLTRPLPADGHPSGGVTGEGVGLDSPTVTR